MKTQKKYTAAIIGTGRIGFSLGLDKKREQPASHTFALKQNPRIKLVAGCDVNKENLNFWAKSNKGCRLYSSATELFSKEKEIYGKVPDIITVAVNEAFHHEIALEAIKAKPLLVILEKPVALNTAEAQEIKEIAQKYDVPVMINHERRFARDYNLARSLISQIGEIQSVTAELQSNLKVWAQKEEERGFYSLLHDGTHLVDIVLFLLNGSASVVELKNPVVSGFFFDSEQSLKNLTVSFECSVCPSVTFKFSGRSSFFGFELDILGTKGRIKIGNGFMEFYKSKTSKLYTGFRSLQKCEGFYSYNKDGKKERAYIHNGKFTGKTKYFSGMVQNAVDFLDGKTVPGSTLDNGIEVLYILEQIKDLIKKQAEKK